MKVMGPIQDLIPVIHLWVMVSFLSHRYSYLQFFSTVEQMSTSPEQLGPLQVSSVLQRITYRSKDVYDMVEIQAQPAFMARISNKRHALHASSPK